MAQAVNENSTWVRAVRSAARRGQLSHAVILTGEGDKPSAARFIAAAHLCRSEGADLMRCFENSFCLSADVSNAFDPNWPETCPALADYC